MMKPAERVLIQTPDKKLLRFARSIVLRSLNNAACYPARAEPLHRIAKRGRIPQVVLDVWEP